MNIGYVSWDVLTRTVTVVFRVDLNLLGLSEPWHVDISDTAGPAAVYEDIRGLQAAMDLHRTLV